MPKSFQEKYPEAMRSLRLNSRKLTTPFDIHETLKSILNFEAQPPEQHHHHQDKRLNNQDKNIQF